jgi:hypothetical protein
MGFTLCPRIAGDFSPGLSPTFSALSRASRIAGTPACQKTIRFRCNIRSVRDGPWRRFATRMADTRWRSEHRRAFELLMALYQCSCRFATPRTMKIKKNLCPRPLGGEAASNASRRPAFSPAGAGRVRGSQPNFRNRARLQPCRISALAGPALAAVAPQGSKPCPDTRRWTRTSATAGRAGTFHDLSRAEGPC